MKVISFLFTIGFILLGAGALVSGIKKYKQCKGKTFGKITGIHESEDRDKDGYLTRYYSPEFEYKVDGHTYHGIGDTSYEHYKKIKIGGNIKVFYNPENPEEHYTKGGGISVAFFGAFLLILGLCGAFAFIDSLIS